MSNTTPCSLLGAILVRHYGLPLSRLQDALDHQRVPATRLGDILTAAGHVTTAQLEGALIKQRELRAANASAPTALLGAVLVRHYGVALVDLQFALEQQQQSIQRLGDLLVERGDITEDDLAGALARQVDLRRPR